MSAIIIPFPARPTMSRAERDLVARWKASALGIARVYVSARRPNDAREVQDRILVIEHGTPESGWVVHRPARRWVVRRTAGMEPLGDYGTLADALAAIEPGPVAAPGRSAAGQAMPPLD